jgi:ketosteroid isomerase-like protein
VTHELTGKTAQSPEADIFRFRDGKIVEFVEFFDTAAAVAASQAD